MGPGAVHNFIESRKIFRILFDKNLLRYIEALRMMGMVIMRPIALDVVFAFIGDDNGIAGQQVFPILFRKDLGFFLFNIVDFFSRKIAAIVDETNVISVEIFPGPIKTCLLYTSDAADD